MPVSRSTLNWLHGLAAGIHLSEAFALTVLVAKENKDAYHWPVTTMGWGKVLPEKTVGYNIGWLLPAFPLLSSVNHFVSVAKPDYYDHVLETKVNYLRWSEFSLSSSLMTLLICQLSGVMEARSLASVILANVALQFLGLLIEKRKAEGATRGELLGITFIGWSVFASMWVPIIMSFTDVVRFDSKVKPPAIVYSIIATMVSLFMSFGVLQLLYVFDLVTFLTYEAGFVLLSLTSKTLLAWMVYGGVLAGKMRFEK